MVTRTHGLQSWIDRLNQAELPALAAVVHDLQRLTAEHSASVQQLADVLLRDATLTSKVLRVANSAHYNPAREPIRTLSRAIVLIGFDTVRAIGVSVCLVDGLLGKAPREQLTALLARAFHGAVQARTIAGYVLGRQQEEVFIAALLKDLGELAFWGCAGSQADDLAAALAEPGVDVEATVRDRLGTGFRQLTQGLAKSWGLGGTVGLALTGHPGDSASDAVQLGGQIAQLALDGWDTPAMAEQLERMAAFIGVEPDQALQLALAGADEAVRVAATFGAEQLVPLIPTRDLTPGRARRAAQVPRLDTDTLSQTLHELGLAAARQDAPGRILDLLLQGLQRGAGLERVMVAVLADGQRRFRAKQVAGEDTGDWLERFELPVQSPEQPHLFDYVVRSREPLWMGTPASCTLNDLVTRPMRQWFGPGMFFVAPLMAGTRTVGVLYADGRPSGRVLRNEQFVAFRHLCKAAGRALEALTRR